MNGLLLTCAGGHLVNALIAALKREYPARRIVGADARPLDKKSVDWDALYVVPKPNDANYLQSVFDICKRESISCVLPGSDDEAEVLAGASERFDLSGIKINVMPLQKVKDVRDKQGTYRVLQHHGLRVPKVLPCGNSDELAFALEKFEYPKKRVIVRPNQGRGSRDTFIFEEPIQPSSHPYMRHVSLHEVESLFDFSRSSFASEFIEGSQLSIDVLADHGNLVQAVARLCLNPERLPYQGNRLICSESLASYVSNVVKALGLHGLVDIDAVLDEQGDPYLLEVNPRQSGSVAASLLLGIPVITQLEEMLSGHPIEAVQPVNGRSVVLDNGVLRLA